MKDAGTHEIVLERVEDGRRRHVLDQSSFFGRGAVPRVQHERLLDGVPRERCSFRATELLQYLLALLAVLLEDRFFGFSPSPVWNGHYT